VVHHLQWGPRGIAAVTAAVEGGPRAERRGLDHGLERGGTHHERQTTSWGRAGRRWRVARRFHLQYRGDNRSDSGSNWTDEGRASASPSELVSAASSFIAVPVRRRVPPTVLPRPRGVNPTTALSAAPACAWVPCTPTKTGRAADGRRQACVEGPCFGASVQPDAAVSTFHFHLCEDLKPSDTPRPRPARGAVIAVGSPLTRIPCASLPLRFAWHGLHAPQAEPNAALRGGLAFVEPPPQREW